MVIGRRIAKKLFNFLLAENIFNNSNLIPWGKLKGSDNLCEKKIVMSCDGNKVDQESIVIYCDDDSLKNNKELLMKQVEELKKSEKKAETKDVSEDLKSCIAKTKKQIEDMNEDEFSALKQRFKKNNGNKDDKKVESLSLDDFKDAIRKLNIN